MGAKSKNSYDKPQAKTDWAMLNVFSNVAPLKHPKTIGHDHANYERAKRDNHGSC
jgi:hypothetical protein